MAETPQPKPRSAGNDETLTPDYNQLMLRCAYAADIKGVVEALKAGADVNATDPFMGLTALHIAVSTNNLSLTRILVEDWHAAFKADAAGRWPTLIAAEAEVDDALSDYIVEAEAEFIG
ncbi:ankyrin repeat domain-containing protein [Shinella pollutisoli]|uniref:Ankyrin repeat domain-containing protein n=1 Tax=Shinella pollutisoli TaxID=2250594 RepID=A0ABV7D9L4_9HYPH|nr:ankyrin repeat domain-containing protein [Shinella pollutisoli]